MPMKIERYPANWNELATAIKDAAGWQCQQCGKRCRKPGQTFDTHKRTLTVAHLWPGDHAPDAPEVFVAALCAPCHLQIDNARRKEARAAVMHQPTQPNTPRFWGKGFNP